MKKKSTGILLVIFIFVASSYLWSAKVMGEAGDGFTPEEASYDAYTYVSNNANITACSMEICESLRDINEKATLVVSGAVLNADEQIGEHLKSQIAKVQVEEVIRGEVTGDVIDVIETGERLADGRDLSIDSVPLMKAGDRVFLMLYLLDMPTMPDRQLWNCVAEYGGKFFYKDEDSVIYAGSLAYEQDGKSFGEVQLEEFAYSDYDEAMDIIESKCSPEDVRELKAAVDRSKRKDFNDRVTSKVRKARAERARKQLNTDIEKIRGLNQTAKQDRDVEISVVKVKELINAKRAASISKSALVEAVAD